MRYTGMNTKSPYVIATWQAVVILLSWNQPVAAGEGFRFFYNFAPGVTFYEMDHSRQESGSKLISEFRRTIEFRVSQAHGAALPTLSARIIELSNKGRRIDYYNGVQFEANISATGEVTEYSFSGGLPRYQPLIQAAGAANRNNIFWMPRFPGKPVKIGDSFTDTVFLNGAGMEAGGQTVFELEEVRDKLARFKLRHTGSTSGGGAGGTQVSQGHAIFDLDKGMWSSFELSGEGTAQLAGALSQHYKTSSRKEISRNGGCDQATTGVSNPDSAISHARTLANQLVHNALARWPGTGENLYASYRHFHCPNRPQMTMIRDNLAAAEQILGNLTLTCLPASADVCSNVRGSEVNLPVESLPGGASGSRLVQLCPSFFHMDDDEQAGTLIAAAIKLSGVGDSHRCMLQDDCYFDFLRPAAEVVGGNPYAYGYYALALSGWTFSREPSRTPCFPQASGNYIQVDGGAAATDPASVQPYRGDFYEIFSDPATGDRFIWHNNLSGAGYYLYGETGMRYYLPGD